MNLDGLCLGDAIRLACDPLIIGKIFTKMYGSNEAKICTVHISKHDDGGAPWIPFMKKLLSPVHFVQFVNHVNKATSTHSYVVHYFLVGYSGITERRSRTCQLTPMSERSICRLTSLLHSLFRCSKLSLVSCC